MVNNSINWLGNPVVGGSSPGSNEPTPATPFYPLYTGQESQTENSAKAQNEMSADPPIQSLQNQQSAQYQRGILNPQGTLNQQVPLTQQGPPPVTDVGYVPAYLASNIGKNVRAEFIINTSYIDKAGKLIEVGINYFVLEDINSRTHIMCDLYSVKFVTVLQF
jgi:hypothetical protein